MSPSKDQPFLDKLADKLRREQNDGGASSAADPLTNGHGRSPSSGTLPTDEAVIGKCRSAKNAAKFADLFDRGDVHTYNGGDDSAADLALLGILKFYTQDAAQLERLFSASAFGRREKWRDRPDYRRLTIARALQDPGEAYDWGRKDGHRLLSSLSSSLGKTDDDDNNEDDDFGVVRFKHLGKRKPREYLVKDVCPKGYPVVVFGAGGVAKSLGVLRAGIAIAGNGDEWLGLKVMEHGPVLYIDFELDIDEQQRRVEDLCTGAGAEIPEDLGYISGAGQQTEEVFRRAYKWCVKHKAVAVVVDSMGLATRGRMDGEDIIAFHTDYMDHFRNIGVTPLIVDHEAKLQAGEKRRQKSPINSVYKTNLSRSVLQFEYYDYNKGTKELDVIVRHQKVNLGPRLEPFGVRFTFGPGDSVTLSRVEIDLSEFAEEESLNSKDKIKAAIQAGYCTIKAIANKTGLAEGTVRNKISEMMNVDICEDGYEGRNKRYKLLSSSPEPPRGNDNDDNENDPAVAVIEDYKGNYDASGDGPFQEKF